MAKVTICVEIDESAYRSFEEEARREGVSLESLLERTVKGLLEELEAERAEGSDHPIVPA